MAPTAHRAATPASIAVAALLAACGGPSAPPVDPPPPPAFRCTGPEPAHATLCPGADQGLAADVARWLSTSCGQAPCAYACLPGYALLAGACQPPPADPPVVTRLTDEGNGTVTVTDTAGTLVWLRDAGCADAAGGVVPTDRSLTWDDAVIWSSGLAEGACGLADGSAAGDWRLPSHAQLLHLLVDLEVADPFTGIQGGAYWTSWTYWRDRADGVDVFTGTASEIPKTSLLHAWPVRDPRATP